MKKEVKILIAISLAVIIAAVFAAGAYNTSVPPDPASAPVALDEEQTAKLTRADSYRLGPAMAKVTMVEFLDPECEACKAFHPVVKRILKDYEGRIQFVVRYMSFHKSSAMAVAATEAAGLQGKYWEMQELLFNEAEAWGHRSAPDQALFIQYATSLGLDTTQFTKDLADPRWQEKLERDMEDGGEVGVRGTPTVFINGRKISDLSYDALAAEIERILGAGP